MLKLCNADVMEFILILLILFGLQLRMSLLTHPHNQTNKPINQLQQKNISGDDIWFETVHMFNDSYITTHTPMKNFAKN